MKLKSITLKNFRCFENYQLELASHCTVFIGKNGVGKSNLISGLKRGLNFIFSKNKGIDGNLFAAGSDLHAAGFSPFDARYDGKDREFKYPIEISYLAHTSSSELNWAFVKNQQKGGLLSSRYKAALNQFLDLMTRDEQKEEYPLLAFFSDSYPHNKGNIGSYAKATVNKRGPLPWQFGYYQWDGEVNCADIWQLRYIKVYNTVNDFKHSSFLKKDRFVELLLEKTKDSGNKKLDRKIESLKKELSVLQNESKEFLEINYIDSILKRFTGKVNGSLLNSNPEFEIKNIIVERPQGLKNHLILLEFVDGKEIHFDRLPQGYRRLLSMVLDLAYRSYALNVSIEPKGIVFIDEIELHLHPSLQQEVLKRFEYTFPHIQFIVSTHSPLIISNLKADDETRKVISLKNDGLKYSNEEVENVYGLNYVTNLREVMEVPARGSTVDKLIQAYLLLYGKGETKRVAAETVLKKLKEYLGGEIPGLLQAEIDRQKASYQA